MPRDEHGTIQLGGRPGKHDLLALPVGNEEQRFERSLTHPCQAIHNHAGQAEGFRDVGTVIGYAGA